MRSETAATETVGTPTNTEKIADVVYKMILHDITVEKDRML
jgi:hypothetical protein